MYLKQHQIDALLELMFLNLEGNGKSSHHHHADPFSIIDENFGEELGPYLPFEKWNWVDEFGKTKLAYGVDIAPDGSILVHEISKEESYLLPTHPAKVPMKELPARTWREITRVNEREYQEMEEILSHFIAEVLLKDVAGVGHYVPTKNGHPNGEFTPLPKSYDINFRYGGEEIYITSIDEDEVREIDIFKHGMWAIPVYTMEKSKAEQKLSEIIGKEITIVPDKEEATEA